MPFDDTEFFSTHEVEPDIGVKAVFNIFEDSVHQYSRAKAQRGEDARNQIVTKKEKNIRAGDKENIEVTISEDLADGYSAKLDASLKLLSEDDLKLLLPNHELEDDEVHIIQTTDVALWDGYALQDYQTQLMLLEQQNRKRLLLAKQDQDVDFTQFDRLASIEYERRTRGQTIYKEQLRLTAAEEPSSGLGTCHVKKKMPNSSVHKGAASATKRRKRNSHSHIQPDHQNHLETANGECSKKMDTGDLEVKSVFYSSRDQSSLTVYYKGHASTL